MAECLYFGFQLKKTEINNIIKIESSTTRAEKNDWNYLINEQNNQNIEFSANKSNFAH